MKKFEKLKVGKKYRITVKDDNESFTVKAVVISNDIKKKLLKFETKEDVYESKYDEIKKAQSLNMFWLKVLLLSFIFVLLLYYFGYNANPIFHPSCKGWKSFEPLGGGCTLKWQCNNGKCGCDCDPDEPIAFKPIIYLYPEEITNVTVALGYPENTTHTYPKYQGPWQVQAEPNGDLTDLKTGRHYYALYWEGKNTVSTDTPTEGFIVKGEETIPFLEEKLDQLGLTEREAEEFIVYWLPKLESNPYNFIRFQTMAEQNKNMPLIITPAPKTLIRVMMEYDNLDNPIQIKEQTLPSKPERNGFTVVEWGGTKLNIKEK